MPQPVSDAVTEALIKQRRLSSAHGNMARSVAVGHDPAQEARLLQSNITSINQELSRTRDPKIRALLLGELAKLQPQNLVGPRGVGDMLRPPEGPQLGAVLSDSTHSLQFPPGYNAQDPGILNTPFRDPAAVREYEQRQHGVHFAPYGGPAPVGPREM